MTGAPSEATTAFTDELERLRRLAGLRVDTVARAVQDVDDAAGWARLVQLGTEATVDAQRDATAAAGSYLRATLAASGVRPDGVTVPIRPGVLDSGRDVRGMFAATPDVVRGRMSAGATFDEALDSSATYLVGKASSEPHRIGRDGQLAAGLTDDRFERFRRIVEPGACDFCRMLATRGAVYLTEETAGKHRDYHTRCRCLVLLVVSEDAIAESKNLSKDWRNAIRDEERMRASGAMTAAPPPPAEIIPDAPAASQWDDERARMLLNDELDAELADAYARADLDAADTLAAEMERRERWAVDWGRPYQDFDELVENDRAWVAADLVDDATDDLPDFGDVPQKPLSRRAARAQWEDEQDIRRDEAETWGGGIRSELADEARSRGVTLWTLMTGDPRTAYKYANEELLGWWAQHGGRKPFWEFEAANGRLSTSKKAQRALTEDKARSLAQEMLGKNRAEGMARRAAEKAATRRAKAGPRTVGDEMKAARRRYRRLRELGMTVDTQA